MDARSPRPVFRRQLPAWAVSGCAVLLVHGMALRAVWTTQAAPLRQPKPELTVALEGKPTPPTPLVQPHTRPTAQAERESPRPRPAASSEAPRSSAAPSPATVQREEVREALPSEVATPSPAAEPAPAPPAEENPPPVRAPRFDAGYLNNPAPAYPPISRRLGEHGRVVLRVYVDETGAVAELHLAQRSGYPRLDEAALEAVRRWRFVPARQGDKAVAAWVSVPLGFDLEH